MLVTEPSRNLHVVGSTQFLEEVQKRVLSFIRPSSRKRSRLGRWPPASHRRGADSIPGQTMRDLW